MKYRNPIVGLIIVNNIEQRIQTMKEIMIRLINYHQDFNQQLMLHHQQNQQII